MQQFRLAVLLSSVLALAACGDDGEKGDKPPLHPPVPAPLVEGPVTGGAGMPTLPATSFDLADVGYRQDEYFVSGTARAYKNVGDLGSDGDWQIEEQSAADYKTRIVVYRPIDEADFNGMVFVEWLNVSAGFDSAPDWIYAHVELIRQGYAYVGVSAQLLGIEGGDGFVPIPGLDLSLKNNDPERYGTLVHPGDGYSYDIYSQVGRAMHERTGVDPLDGLDPEYVIAAGESQSAWRMVTYVNAFAPWAEIYDGYLVHSRPGSSPPLAEEPLEFVNMPAVVRIRTDLEVPVMTFQAETDLIELGSHADRQDDSKYFRWWEAAGTAHADTYTLIVGPNDVGGDPRAAEIIVTNAPIPGVIECAEPINSGPHHFILKASIRALEHWVRDGTEPPVSPRFEVTTDPEVALVRDDLGNTIGGIRTAYVDVPVARLLGDGQEGEETFCFLFGKTIPFDQATLDDLYADHESYVAAVETSTQEAVDAGFLLPVDADLIVEAAEQSDIGR